MNIMSDMSKGNRYISAIIVMLLPVLLCAQEYRSIDGSGNNVNNSQWGAINSVQERLGPADYLDGVSAPRTGDSYNRPNPRVISNNIFQQNESRPDILSLSDYAWGFGQFLDHDIVQFQHGDEFYPIVVGEGDDYFAPGSVIPFVRNACVKGSGEGTTPRQYHNKVTSFVDGSNVYGSTKERAEWLRSFDGGKLKVSENNLLPWNTTDGLFNSPLDPNAPEMDDETRQISKHYIAGDARANENPILIAMHTLFVREHNRLCDVLAKENPNWNDEKLYQEARQINIGYIQNIAFNEWLPAMGVTLPTYHRYQADMNPTIYNEFSSAAFRLGHTLISSEMIRMGNDGAEMKRGRVKLRDAYFNPLLVNLSGGIEPFLIGMGTQVQQKFDNKIINDLRSFLFGGGKVGLDLAAINILRGRERGLPSYNVIREYVGLPKVRSFSDLTNDPESLESLAKTYQSIDDVDAWVGMVSEKNVENSIFGELVMRILGRQFQVLRDADRFYFENLDVNEAYKEDIRNTKMRDIIMRNADIDLMQKQVFKAMPHAQIEQGPELEKYPLAVAAYPNPVVDVTTLKIFCDKEQAIDVLVYDMNGGLVMQKHIHTYKGVNYLKIEDLKGERPGTYNVLVQGSNRYTVFRITKV